MTMATFRRQSIELGDSLKCQGWAALWQIGGHGYAGVAESFLHPYSQSTQG